MLLSDWNAAHNKKKPTTDTNYFNIPWKKGVVRFSQDLQLLDLADCMAAVYKNYQTADVEMRKYFKVDMQKTSEAIGISQELLMHKVKWQDSMRGRLCLNVKHLKLFMEKVLQHMPHSVKLASIIDKEYITVENMTVKELDYIEDISTAESINVAKDKDGEYDTKQRSLVNNNECTKLVVIHNELMAIQAEHSLRRTKAEEASYYEKKTFNAKNEKVDMDMQFYKDDLVMKAESNKLWNKRCREIDEESKQYAAKIQRMLVRIDAFEKAGMSSLAEEMKQQMAVV